MRYNLKKTRIEKGFSKQDLAKRLGISLSCYEELESGKSNGSKELWSALEDVLFLHQRLLRSNRHPF